MPAKHECMVTSSTAISNTNMSVVVLIWSIENPLDATLPRGSAPSQIH